MSEQISSCPFCGKMPLFTSLPRGEMELSCDNQGMLPHIEIRSWGYDRGEVVQNWNDDIETLLENFTITKKQP